MAIYHLSVKCISRAQGRSATAAAAYRSATKIHDHRTGELHDFTRKGGIVHTEIVLPEGAPTWAQDRERLWNEAELAETRRNSTVAREFEVALPKELDPDARQALAMELARGIAERHGCAVDLAIHRPGRQDDNRNHHAHVLCTTRRLSGEGFGAKTRELDDKKTGEVEHWREQWAQLTNRALEKAKIAERVDHRSLADQGIDREPTMHLGPAIAGILERGGRSHVAERWQEEANERLRFAKEEGELSREAQLVRVGILDVTSSLQAALRARDQSKVSALQDDEPRQRAAERWSDLRRTPDGFKSEGRELNFETQRSRGAELRPHGEDHGLSL